MSNIYTLFTFILLLLINCILCYDNECEIVPEEGGDEFYIVVSNPIYLDYDNLHDVTTRINLPLGKIIRKVRLMCDRIYTDDRLRALTPSKPYGVYYAAIDSGGIEPILTEKGEGYYVYTFTSEDIANQIGGVSKCELMIDSSVYDKSSYLYYSGFFVIYRDLNNVNMESYGTFSPGNDTKQVKLNFPLEVDLRDHDSSPVRAIRIKSNSLNPYIKKCEVNSDNRKQVLCDFVAQVNCNVTFYFKNQMGEYVKIDNVKVGNGCPFNKVCFIKINRFVILMVLFIIGIS